MVNVETFEEDDFPQVEEVTATRSTGVRYNSDRGFVYNYQKET